VDEIALQLKATPVLESHSLKCDDDDERVYAVTVASKYQNQSLLFQSQNVANKKSFLHPTSVPSPQFRGSLSFIQSLNERCKR
jgi:hypothetical protein